MINYILAIIFLILFVYNILLATGKVYSIKSSNVLIKKTEKGTRYLTGFNAIAMLYLFVFELKIIYGF